MKKVLAGTAVAVSLFVIMTGTAFAGNHGGAHNSRTSQDSPALNGAQSICHADGCMNTYSHSHDGSYYDGHHNGDSHGHGFALCQAEGCTREYDHRHDGVSYAGHANGDGHSHSFASDGSRAACDLEGCTKTNDHSHNGAGYYGHENGDGHTFSAPSGGGNHNSGGTGHNGGGGGHHYA